MAIYLNGTAIAAGTNNGLAVFRTSDIGRWSGTSYLFDNYVSGSYAIGATSITVGTSASTYKAGFKIKFGTDNNIYTIQNNVSGSTVAITISPGLVAAVSNGTQLIAAGQVGLTSSWTVPTGVTQVYATVVGGGGGRGNNYYNEGSTFYPGGAGEVKYRQLVTGLTPGASIPITVGSGGARHRTSSTVSGAGDAGSASSFGSYVTASGGGGGCPGGVATYGVAVGEFSFRNVNIFSANPSSGSTTVGFGGGGSSLTENDAYSSGLAGVVILEW